MSTSSLATKGGYKEPLRPDEKKEDCELTPKEEIIEPADEFVEPEVEEARHTKGM